MVKRFKLDLTPTFFTHRYLTDIGSMTEEVQDLLFRWTVDLQGSDNIVGDVVTLLTA